MRFFNTAGPVDPELPAAFQGFFREHEVDVL